MSTVNPCERTINAPFGGRLPVMNRGKRQRMSDDRPDADDTPKHVREGGGGKPVAADDPRDTSVAGKDAGEAAEKSTPPTEGPAAAGALPG